MQENQMGPKPQVSTDLESQIAFVDFMMEGYLEPTGRSMLQAIRDSLNELKEKRGSV